MIDEVILAVYISLTIVTSGVMLVYYKRTRQGSKEYVKAKTALDEIVLSFDKDLESQTREVREIAIRGEGVARESLRAVERVDSEISSIKDQLSMSAKMNEMLQANYDTLKKNVDDLSSQRVELLERMSRLESLREETGVTRIAGEPAIPLRRERALAPLHDTELRVLELLAKEGEKTAPQIREEIKLTREHTARLMKKLFAGGYVERSTDSMPYVYRLKREMKNLLEEQNPAG